MTTMTTTPTTLSLYSCDALHHEGSIGYLVGAVCEGEERFVLLANPPRTNISREPRLNGWLGETNDRSRTAYGLRKVVAVDEKRERVRLGAVTVDELRAFLEPELIPAGARERTVEVSP
jgi:hypothetical protein